MNLNKIMIAGRLGKDPEFKQINDKTSVCKFTVATNHGKKDNERTEWHNVVTFNKTAEHASKYFTKGKLIFVEGRIQTDSYEKDGQKKYFTEVIADRIEFVGGKADTPAPQAQDASGTATSDDIPF